MSEHTYTLVATLGSQTRRCTFEVWAPSYEAVRLSESLGEEDPYASGVRLDVVATAIREILNHAAHGPGEEFWRSGSVELVGPKGDVMHSMPAKGED